MSSMSIIKDNSQISIIIPTYNESQNILNVLKSIGDIIIETCGFFLFKVSRVID